ncbi:Aste57867_519 [Aphanomyces stellatus]|uniref:Aste57867_519 protein n=1 Tax=Aphanomyces stellatus TaxID=120398 RepID=A0A485K7U2_9STRA|nr:hypothetical protein As57867_000518 [Aphanomyces stellatus]VFT77744.1 Aste57867_519 [Aphanomyces stellatus]
MTFTNVAVASLVAASAAAATCPSSYSSYNQIVTVSACTTKDAPWCIVNGKCEEQKTDSSFLFTFEDGVARVGHPFDGLIAELPGAATSGVFTYAYADVGDLSANTKLTSLSFYRTNRADLTKAKLPASLRDLNLMSVAGLTSLPSLDYSKLTSFSAGNQLTAISNLDVSSAVNVSFAPNDKLTSISNIALAATLQNFDCSSCPLTTFTVDNTGYQALSALSTSNFKVASLDVTGTCKSPNVAKKLLDKYTVCVTSGSSSSNNSSSSASNATNSGTNSTTNSSTSASNATKTDNSTAASTSAPNTATTTSAPATTAAPATTKPVSAAASVALSIAVTALAVAFAI